MDDGSLIWNAGKRAREAFMTPTTGAPTAAPNPMSWRNAPFEGNANLGGVSAIPMPGFSTGGRTAPLVAPARAPGLQIDASTGKVAGLSDPSTLPLAMPEAAALLAPPKPAPSFDFVSSAGAATPPARPRLNALPPSATDSDPRAAVAPIIRPTAPAPTGVWRKGNEFGNGEMPEGATAYTPGGNLSVIRTAPGGGYSGTPGFTASGGNVSTSAELSAARAAAADRGDTDALAASYQANGGTFLGRTAAQDQVASLNKAALMSPRGSRAEKSFLTQAAAVGGQEQARRALDLAETKQAGDQAVQAAQIGQAEATTTGLQQQNQTREQQRKMLQEIADLDPRTDPDGKIRQAKIDAYIATVHGKDIDPKYSVIEEGTGTFDLNGRENTRKVALAHRTGQIIRGQAPAGAPPKGVEGQIMRDAAGNRVQFKDGKWIELK